MTPQHRANTIAARMRRHQKELAARPLQFIDGVIYITLQDNECALATDTPDNRKLIGSRLWTRHPRGYVVSHHNGKLEYLHRLLMPGVKMLDHRNGVKSDCRGENLRACTPAQNASNRPAQQGRKYKGTHRSPSGRYVAQIGYQNRTIYLGRYDTEEQAAMAYDAAALKLHGTFAFLNYPEAATCH